MFKAFLKTVQNFGCELCQDSRHVVRGKEVETCHYCESWTFGYREEKRLERLRDKFRLGERRATPGSLNKKQKELFKKWKMENPSAPDSQIIDWCERASYDPASDPEFLAFMESIRDGKAT